MPRQRSVQLKELEAEDSGMSGKGSSGKRSSGKSSSDKRSSDKRSSAKRKSAKRKSAKRKSVKSPSEDPIASSSDCDTYEIPCRCVRVGDNKFVPNESVLLNPEGVTIAGPDIVDNSEIELRFAWSEIERADLSGGKNRVSAIFLSVSAEANERATSQLDSADPYGDCRVAIQKSWRPSPAHRLVTLFPKEEYASVDWTPAFQHFLKSDEIKHLSAREANDMMSLTSTKFNLKMPSETKASKPESSPEVPSTASITEEDNHGQDNNDRVENDGDVKDKGGIVEVEISDDDDDDSDELLENPYTPSMPKKPRNQKNEWPFQQAKPELIRVICGFPSNDAYPSPVSVSLKSYRCLEDGVFLNDEIIEFYLRWLQENKLSEADRGRSHFFSTKFYTRLTQKAVVNDKNASPAERRYLRVKRWTKNVDIFEKDFIFVPINRGGHWFLAVICHPGLLVPRTMRTDSAESMEEAEVAVADEAKLEPRPAPASSWLAPTVDLDYQAVGDRVDYAAVGDEADATREDMLDADHGIPSWLLFSVTEEAGDGSKSERTDGLDVEMAEAESTTDTEQLKTKRPCILILDSYRSTYLRSRVVVTLREYLECEMRAKKGRARRLTSADLKGHTPKLPQQPNTSDCGIFLLQYVESFFQDPIEGLPLPMTGLAEWFKVDDMRLKRKWIARLIREMAAEQVPVPIDWPKLKLNSGEGYNTASGSALAKEA